MTSNSFDGLAQRTRVSFDNWIAWQDYAVPVRFNNYRIVAKLLKEIGMTEFTEFQVRNGEVRFRNAEDKAFALLNGLNEYKHNV